MDYQLSLEISANARSVPVALNATQQNITQFARRAQQSFGGVADAGKRAAKNIKDDWTKAAREYEQAQKAFATNASSANRRAVQDAGNTLREVQAVRQAAMQDLSRGFLIASAAFGVGLLATVNVTKNFNKEVSTLGAVADASAQDLEALRKAALDAGKASVFTASEAARGAQELARAGVTTRDIVGGGLVGSLNLAAAGQLGLGEAAEIAATAMNVFNLSGTQMSHVADVLAAGAGKAQGSVHEMGYALKQSALVANQFGLSLEETVGGLTLFASSGLIGSDAGTSFRTMLLRLNPQSVEARREMKRLGLDFYDAQGRFVGITAAAGQLQERLGGLSAEQRDAALQVIFGQDAIRGANILVREGADGYKRYIDQVNDFGYASRQAGKNMDNLNGDLERLKGSLEVAIIGTGQQADGVLRDLVQAADLMVNAYSDLPDAVQGGVLAFAGFIAVGTGVVGLVGTMIPKYRALNDALLSINGSGQAMSRALRLTTIGIGLTSAAISAGLLIYGAYAARKAQAKEVTERFAEALRAERDGQTGASNAAIAEELSKRKLVDTMKVLGVQQADYVASLRGDKDATARLTDDILRQNGVLANNSQNYVLLRDALNGNYEARNRLIAINASSLSSNREERKALNALLETGIQLGPMYREQIEEQKKQKLAMDDSRRSALELGRAANLSGGDLERFTQEMTGQKDELGELAVSLNLTRDQLIAFGGDGETAAAEFGKNIKQAVEATSESFAKFGDVVGEFGGKAGTSGAQVQNFYKDVIKKSEEFTKNINKAIEMGLDSGLVSRLLKAGPEAAAPVLQAIISDHSGRLVKMANESEDKLREINSLAVQMARVTNLAVNSQSDQMAKDVEIAMRIVTANYRQGGKSSAEAIAKELGVGVAEVSRISAAYGISITAAANQVRGAFNNAPLQIDYRNAPPEYRKIGSKSTTFFAEGGVENHSAQIAQGQTPYRVWAEPETGGEAYIPLSSLKRGQSTKVLNTVAAHFGLELTDPRNGGSFRSFASGGIFGVFPPPQGSGVVPASGTAVMEHEYKLLLALVEAMQKVGSGWQSITSFLQQKGVPFTITSTTGGKHAAGSYHYAGKAVDMIGPNMLGIFKALEPAVGSLAELFYDPPGYSYKNSRRIGPIGGHRDHVHAATYDRGGDLKTGLTLAYNGTGQTEHVLTSKQIDRLVHAIEKNRGGVTQVISGDSRSVRAIANESARKLR